MITSPGWGSRFHVKGATVLLLMAGAPFLYSCAQRTAGPSSSPPRCSCTEPRHAHPPATPAGQARTENAARAPHPSGIIVKKPTPAELEELGVTAWETWSREPGDLPWTYEQQETCLFLEGEVTVETAKGAVNIGPGDLAIFPKGLECVWKIKKAVKKHYRFE
jgi:hypothetical protein